MVFIAVNYILVWNSHIYSSDGYGEEARSFIRALYAHGLPIVVVAQDTRRSIDILTQEEVDFFNHLVVDPEVLAAKKGQKVRWYSVELVLTLM